MYDAFFGLQRAPFGLTPDPEFLYLTAQHREALAGLTYAMLARKGFVVLTGNAGTGKTLLLTRILQHLPASRLQFSLIVQPTLTPAEFLETMLLDFRFKDISPSKAQRMETLRTFLWERYREGKITALIVDEAHKLSPEVLEEIRMLGNFESTTEKLLQIALVGQSELDELLNRESLRQFKQRVSLRWAIQPLLGTEIQQYIQHRWMKAGGSEAPFTASAIAAIGEASQGVPRVINVLCDNTLIHAFGEGSALVEMRHVLAVCRELQFAEPLPKTTTVAEPPAPAPALEAFQEPVQMRTPQRYTTVAQKPSLRERIVGKFKFRQRIEVA